MNKPIYYPAISVATPQFKKWNDPEFLSGFPQDIRFYQDKFNGFFQHKHTLWSAALHRNEMNLMEEVGMDMTGDVFIDSGGFQLITGIVNEDNWNNQIALEWSEKNGNIYPILDRPVAIASSQKRNNKNDFYNFENCLSMSREAAKYYADNRSAEGHRILNVVSLRSYEKGVEWYDGIKDIPFEGWAFGGGPSFKNCLKMLIHMIQEGEFDRGGEKVYLHMFGLSSAPALLYVGRINKHLSDLGLNVQLSYDSSSAFRLAAYRKVFVPSAVTGFRVIKLPTVEEELFKAMDFLPVHKDSVLGRLDGMTQHMFNHPNEFYLLCSMHNINEILVRKDFVERLAACDSWEVVESYLPKKLLTNVKAIDLAFKDYTKANATIDRLFVETEEDEPEDVGLDAFF